ncbi:hypothetical protein V9K92_11330 [Phyllobacterium sp. CCNWLW109]|uniref:hypothetical protein n=1 Tax=Phyllobacterium sp. CCNWLW109 TaxID=3127479 RepID=UPI00307830F0
MAAGALAVTLLAGTAFAAVFDFAADVVVGSFLVVGVADIFFAGAFAGVAGSTDLLSADFLAAGALAVTLLAGTAFAAVFGFAAGVIAGSFLVAGALDMFLAGVFAGAAGFTAAATGLLSAEFWEAGAFAVALLAAAIFAVVAGLAATAAFLVDIACALATASLTFPEDFFAADGAVFLVAILDAAILDFVTGFACLATLTSQLVF